VEFFFRNAEAFLPSAEAEGSHQAVGGDGFQVARYHRKTIAEVVTGLATNLLFTAEIYTFQSKKVSAKSKKIVICLSRVATVRPSLPRRCKTHYGRM
jgi:hypothetical protein